MKIHYPIKPFTINQHFAGNLPCVKDFGLPTQDVVTGVNNNSCPVGYEKLYKKFGLLGHNGMDLQAGEQNVYAAYDGVVVEKQTVPARGLGLGILTDEKFDADTYLKIRYWHLKSFYKEVGDVVKSGDLIGVTDNTGYSSGNHLHFEGQLMRKDAGGHPYVSLPNNGFGGAIDLEPHFSGFYAEDIPAITLNLRQQIIIILAKLINLLKK